MRLWSCRTFAQGERGGYQVQDVATEEPQDIEESANPKTDGCTHLNSETSTACSFIYIYWLFLSQISLVFLLTSFSHKPTQSPAACLCSIPVITTSPAPSLKPSLSPSAVPPGTCLDKGVACPCESEGQCTECCDGYCEVKGNKLKCWTAP